LQVEWVTAAQPDAAGAEWLAKVHKQLLADDSIQFDLPTLAQPEPPTWLKPLLDGLGKIGPYMIYLFWGAVIIGLAIIAFGLWEAWKVNRRMDVEITGPFSVTPVNA